MLNRNILKSAAIGTANQLLSTLSLNEKKAIGCKINEIIKIK